MSGRRTPRRNPKTGRFVSARSKARRTASGGRRGGRSRRNPVIGPITEVRYYRKGEPRSLPEWSHKAGDMGVAQIKSKAKLVAGKGGKLSISGMRWTSAGIIG